MVHAVTEVVLLRISLPDLPESERLFVEDEARIEIAIVEARYNGYVFAPAFALND